MSVIKRTGLVVLGALALGAIEQGLRIRRAVARQESIVVSRVDRRVERAKARLLVLGDSTGVGVGAGSYELAVAGRIAREMPELDIVNVSRIGARVADVAQQIEQLPDSADFDVALLHVGGNDILGGTPVRELEEATEQLSGRLRALARRRIWLGPANVGVAPLWRLPMSWWMSRRSRIACRVFERVARHNAVEFVGFHGAADSARFRNAPGRYFAIDGIHPSAEGYRYCYDRLMRAGALRGEGGAGRSRGVR